MKYLLIILLFVSPFCYGQELITSSGKINLVDTTYVIGKSKFTKGSSGVVSNPSDFTTLYQLSDSINKVKYDTSFGIIELFLRDGVLVRGFGFKVDSLYIDSYFSGFEGKRDKIQSMGGGVASIAVLHNDTLRTTIKAFFQPCSCFIDTKKYYRFIPLESFQDIDIYEDEHISISPNENYKK